MAVAFAAAFTVALLVPIVGAVLSGGMLAMQIAASLELWVR